MLYELNKFGGKKIIYAGLAVLVVLLLIFVAVFVWQGRKRALLPKIPGGQEVKSPEEKQKEMLDAISKANAGQIPLSPEEQTKKQQEMLDAINKANEGVQPVSPEEAAKKQQEMLDAINEANRK